MAFDENTHEIYCPSQHTIPEGHVALDPRKADLYDMVRAPGMLESVRKAIAKFDVDEASIIKQNLEEAVRTRRFL